MGSMAHKFLGYKKLDLDFKNKQLCLVEYFIILQAAKYNSLDALNLVDNEIGPKHFSLFEGTFFVKRKV